MRHREMWWNDSYDEEDDDKDNDDDVDVDETSANLRAIIICKY